MSQLFHIHLKNLRRSIIILYLMMESTYIIARSNLEDSTTCSYWLINNGKSKYDDGIVGNCTVIAV